MAETMLTNSEWYVLDCLWERAPQTVTQLVPILKEKVGWAKSTTITTLRRMEDKGLVRAEVRGRTRHYFPAVDRARAVRRETRSFLDRVYRGSVGLMVSAMAQDQALTREEIDALYEVLRRAERKGGEGT